MKHRIVICLVIALLILLTACSGSPSTPVSVSDAVEPTLTPAPAEPSSAPVSNSESLPTVDEPVLETYKDITLLHAPQFTYTDNGGTATLTYEPQVAFVNLLSNESMNAILSDVSEPGTGLELQLSSYLNGLSDISERDDYDLTIDGSPAKGATVKGEMQGTSIMISIVCFDVDETNYALMYAESLDNPPSMSYVDNFVDLLDTIKITPA